MVSFVEDNERWKAGGGGSSGKDKASLSQQREPEPFQERLASIEKKLDNLTSMVADEFAGMARRNRLPSFKHAGGLSLGGGGASRPSSFKSVFKQSSATGNGTSGVGARACADSAGPSAEKVAAALSASGMPASVLSSGVSTSGTSGASGIGAGGAGGAEGGSAGSAAASEVMAMPTPMGVDDYNLVEEVDVPGAVPDLDSKRPEKSPSKKALASVLRRSSGSSLRLGGMPALKEEMSTAASVMPNTSMPSLKQHRKLRASQSTVEAVSVSTRKRLAGMSISEGQKRIETMAVTLHLTMLLSLWGLIQESVRLTPHRTSWKCIHHPHVQVTVSVLISIHALLIGIMADDSLRVSMLGSAPEEWIPQVERCFTIFFIAELLLRMIVDRWWFVLGEEWRWNALDFTVVVVSVVDLASSAQVTEVSMARIARFARFVRLMRMGRVMKHLRSLRTILFALIDSFASLFWCFVFITFIQFMYSVLVVQAAADFFDSEGLDTGSDAATELRVWWGGIYRSMITLFMAISGGVDWHEASRPLKAIHSSYEGLFVVYIFFMFFGVLNVVVGSFVATTTMIVQGDRESMVKYELDQFKRYGEKLKHFFYEADADHSGSLSWEEFSEHLQDPKVKAYFQALDLDVSQAHMLFDLIDKDESNQVSLDEFLDGCVRLKGQARSVDLNMLLLLCERAFTKILVMQATSEDEDEGWPSNAHVSNSNSHASFSSHNSHISHMLTGGSGARQETRPAWLTAMAGSPMG